MSIVEEARKRLEEIRGTVRGESRLTTLEERFPKIKELRAGKLLRGGAILGEEGILGRIGEVFPRVGEIARKRPFRGEGVTETSQKPGLVEDIYLEKMRSERGRDLSVQM